MEDGRRNRKKVAIAGAAIVVLAALIAGGLLLRGRIPRHFVMGPVFVWQSGFTQTVNDMTLKVEAIPGDHAVDFRTTIIDLRSDERWQRTFTENRPLHLCDDRKRVLMAELAHFGKGVHLAFWKFRHRGLCEPIYCDSIEFLTNDSRLTIRPDGRYIAAVYRSRKGNGYNLHVVDLQTWKGRNLLWNRRALQVEFNGDRLLIDDSFRRYALVLDTMKLSPERAGLRW